VPGIYIETHGCQMNEADSNEIADHARANGYEIATDPTQASVLVLNTCTVRDNAERRAYGRIHHWKAIKTADPTVKVVVAGCLAEQDRDRMRTIAPHIDGLFGTQEIARLGEALARWRPEFADLADDAAREERALLAPLGGRADGVVDAYSHLRAFVTVQRGCSYYCTFCIVPHVRGRFDHRPTADILAEVRTAIARGAREVTLVGQTVNAWRDPATGADFADLLETIGALPGVESLAFVTSHPKDYTAKLARTMGSLPALAARFHLPMQSGSDAMLRRMNRKYTIAEYREKIATFRAACPDWALSTDVIVGFPGESEEDFAQTLAQCAATSFSQAFMFVYSRRRGTPADKWEQVPAGTGQARLLRLAAVVDAGIRARHETLVGRTLRALVQGDSRKDASKLAAKTRDNVTVVAPRVVGSDAEIAARPWLDVRIDGAFTWGCVGTIVGAAAHLRDAAQPATLAPRPPIDLLALA